MRIIFIDIAHIEIQRVLGLRWSKTCRKQEIIGEGIRGRQRRTGRPLGSDFRALMLVSGLPWRCWCGRLSWFFSAVWSSPGPGVTLGGTVGCLPFQTQFVLSMATWIISNQRRSIYKIIVFHVDVTSTLLHVLFLTVYSVFPFNILWLFAIHIMWCNY